MSFTFAIGDIHGCHAELGAMLEAIEAMSAGGRIVFLGDYVDRGPDSKGVLARVMAGPARPDWQWIALKGNHEAMMAGALLVSRNVQLWFDNGGEETFASFDGRVPAGTLAWIDALPSILVDPHRIFVHAFVDESLPLEAQPEQTLLWKRPTPQRDRGYWGRHLCHGHTPSASNPETIGNRTNIDSGCVYGGALTAAVFDDDRPGPPIRFLTIPSRPAF